MNYRGFGGGVFGNFDPFDTGLCGVYEIGDAIQGKETDYTDQSARGRYLSFSPEVTQAKATAAHLLEDGLPNHLVPSGPIHTAFPTEEDDKDDEDDEDV